VTWLHIHAQRTSLLMLMLGSLHHFAEPLAPAHIELAPSLTR
jgi:hypothetical protein